MHDTGMDFLEAYKALTLEYIRPDGLGVPSMAWFLSQPEQVGKKSLFDEAEIPCSLAGSGLGPQSHNIHSVVVRIHCCAQCWLCRRFLMFCS